MTVSDQVRSSLSMTNRACEPTLVRHTKEQSLKSPKRTLVSDNTRPWRGTHQESDQDYF